MKSRPIYILSTIVLCSVLAGAARAQPIRSLVEMIDLKCYRIEGDVHSLDFRLRLDHLNPVLREMGLPPQQVIVREPQQLCVPMAKNLRIPPGDVLRPIQFLDLKKYSIDSDIQTLDLPLHLDHLNPVFREFGMPPEDEILREPQQLGVPVAKNGMFPPST